MTQITKNKILDNAIKGLKDKLYRISKAKNGIVERKPGREKLNENNKKGDEKNSERN